MLPALPEEVLHALSEDLLESLPPERRLAGLAPMQRVAGLSPEEVLPELPVEVLRALSEEYLRSLPPDVAEKIRKRLGR